MDSRERFEAFWPFLMEWEGRTYENDPDDPGGATKFGIDQRSHPGEDIRDLTEKRAKEIYWREYWAANNCDMLAPPLGEIHFDSCVNTGPGRATRFLLTAQGDSGKYLDAREAFYRNLADATPRMRKFLQGWLNRTAALRKRYGVA